MNLFTKQVIIKIKECQKDDRDYWPIEEDSETLRLVQQEIGRCNYDPDKIDRVVQNFDLFHPDCEKWKRFILFLKKIEN